MFCLPKLINSKTKTNQNCIKYKMYKVELTKKNSKYIFYRMSTEEQLQNCKVFITVWMISFSSRVSFHFLMIFCRQRTYFGKCFPILFLKFLCRFIYVRYASGLLKEGLSMLHWLTMILMTLLCINTIIIYPIRFII